MTPRVAWFGTIFPFLLPAHPAAIPSVAIQYRFPPRYSPRRITSDCGTLWPQTSLFDDDAQLRVFLYCLILQSGPVA